MEGTSATTRIRFGDFEVNLETGELYRKGASSRAERILLREQPFQILRMLIERCGELVTREEIKKQLWPDDTLVDFDHSINVAIGTLRRALGDSADQPRYIETLARRGYRLAVDVEWEKSAADSAPETPIASSFPDIPDRRVSKAAKWFGAAAVLVILVAAGVYWRQNHRTAISHHDTIVLAVSNQTGDPAFNDALYNALRISLEQTPYLNTLGLTKVAAALAALHLSADPTAVTPQLALDVCRQTSSKMAVGVSLSEAGNAFRIALQGIDCHTGKAVAEVRRDTPDRNDVIRTLGQTVADLRRKLGEPDSSVTRFNQPLDEATSWSPDALQLLTEGYRRHMVEDLSGAISYYQRAVKIDPDFGLAHMALAAAHDALSQKNLAAEEAAKSYTLRGRLTVPTRFAAEHIYYEFDTGDLEKDRVILEEWVKTFPDDLFAHNFRHKGLSLLGYRDAALAEARETVRLYPSAMNYDNLALMAILSDRFDEAAAAYAESDARKFDATFSRPRRLELAFLRRDEAAMRRDWMTGRPATDYLLFYGKASIETYFGRFRASHPLNDEAERLAVQAGVSPLAMRYSIVLDEAEAGNVAEARRLLARPGILRDQDEEVALALACARSGQVAEARRHAEALRQAGPLDTLVQFYYVPTILAAADLEANDPAKAVERLKVTEKYDMAYPDAFNSVYPAYIRGLAYLQLREGSLAAAEFQKLVHHPGMIGRDVIGALVYLHLARALRLSGDEAGARKAYEDFLELWRDADADLAPYRQAKAEYASLR